MQSFHPKKDWNPSLWESQERTLLFRGAFAEDSDVLYDRCPYPVHTYALDSRRCMLFRAAFPPPPSSSLPDWGTHIPLDFFSPVPGQQEDTSEVVFFSLFHSLLHCLRTRRPPAVDSPFFPTSILQLAIEYILFSQIPEESKRREVALAWKRSPSASDAWSDYRSQWKQTERSYQQYENDLLYLQTQWSSIPSRWAVWEEETEEEKGTKDDTDTTWSVTLQSEYTLAVPTRWTTLEEVFVRLPFSTKGILAATLGSDVSPMIALHPHLSPLHAEESWKVRERTLSLYLSTDALLLRSGFVTTTTGSFACVQIRHDDTLKGVPSSYWQVSFRQGTWPLDEVTAFLHDIIPWYDPSAAAKGVDKESIPLSSLSVLVPQWYLQPIVLSWLCVHHPLFRPFLRVVERKKDFKSASSECPVRWTPLAQDLFSTRSEYGSFAQGDLILHSLFRQTTKHQDLSVFVKPPASSIQQGFEVAILSTSLMDTRKKDAFLYLWWMWRDAYYQELPRLFSDVLSKDKAYEAFEREQRKWIVEKRKSPRSSHSLQWIYPDIFPPGVYSRKCQLRRQPTLVDEKEARQYEDSRWIRFPSEATEKITPSYYLCKNPDFPYIGLQSIGASSSSSLLFPQVPCCYIKDTHKEKAKEKAGGHAPPPSSSKALHYRVVLSHLISTEGQRGILPDEILLFFTAAFPRHLFERVGIPTGPFSFLSAVEYAYQFHRTKGSSTQTPDDDRSRSLSERLTELQDQWCKKPRQSSAGIALSHIRSLCTPTSDRYLDPRLVMEAIEDMYHITVVVFSRDRQSGDVRCLQPYSLRGYARWAPLDPTRPVVCIYEHWGGDVNLLTSPKYPHCELIGWRQDPQNTEITSFFLEATRWNSLPPFLSSSSHPPSMVWSAPVTSSSLAPTTTSGKTRASYRIVGQVLNSFHRLSCVVWSVFPSPEGQEFRFPAFVWQPLPPLSSEEDIPVLYWEEVWKGCYETKEIQPLVSPLCLDLFPCHRMDVLTSEIASWTFQWTEELQMTVFTSVASLSPSSPPSPPCDAKWLVTLWNWKEALFGSHPYPFSKQVSAFLPLARKIMNLWLEASFYYFLYSFFHPAHGIGASLIELSNPLRRKHLLRLFIRDTIVIHPWPTTLSKLGSFLHPDCVPFWNGETFLAPDQSCCQKLEQWMIWKCSTDSVAEAYRYVLEDSNAPVFRLSRFTTIQDFDLEPTEGRIIEWKRWNTEMQPLCLASCFDQVRVFSTPFRSPQKPNLLAKEYLDVWKVTEPPSIWWQSSPQDPPQLVLCFRSQQQRDEFIRSSSPTAQPWMSLFEAEGDQEPSFYLAIVSYS